MGKDKIDYILNNGNGYVKEYDEVIGEIKFEGEYLDGKRNGKGKEYDYDGKLEFEGEFKNDKIWNGKGRIIYKHGGCVGEFKDGRLWNGKEIRNLCGHRVYEYRNGEIINKLE